MPSRTYVMTGATSGLGLAAAHAISVADPAARIIVGARDPRNAAELSARIAPERLRVLILDTASIASAKAFAEQVQRMLGPDRIAGLALNAGIQIVSGDRYSIDGHELTFATNVLGHSVLTAQLIPLLEPGAAVTSTASGTHDPEHKLAKPHNFLGGFFPDIEAVAAGRVSASGDPSQIGRDRYATSKLCNVLYTYGMARRTAQGGPRFIAYDPGLMPGTGLARDHSAAARLAWKTVLPAAARFIDGASTAERSGALLADMLLGRKWGSGTGLHIEFTGQQIPSSRLSYDQAKQDALIDWLLKQSA